MKKTTRILLILLVSCASLFSARAASGRSDSPLQGYVTDAVTKKPVSGVTVSASSQGANASREVTTDADGYFSFVQLPASQVTVQFDKKGYQSWRKAGISIKDKATTKLNVEVMPENSEQEGSDAEYPILRMLHMN